MCSVRVGIGVFIIKDGKILMGRRLGSHGEGSWSLPGGHLEYAESFENTAAREVMEETGLEITNIEFGGITNDIFEIESKHYVTIWMTSSWARGIPIILEPNKYIDLGWYELGNLPTPLFEPWNNLLNSTFMTEIKLRINRLVQNI